ncbi:MULTISPECIES: hypothetical protein [unclassified Aureispira]|uniref:hypothetical protein n=1 Tax=unclassified Aureispira TaxID=2649989 RepID=UPI000698A1BF|nr:MULTISPECIES: hypothetical protein [unclassified Aureispira]WMX16177.1 hypothetical protein QP953_07350 [Aureispira sp. CCB-E]
MRLTNALLSLFFSSLLISCGGDTAPKDLELTQDVSLEKFNLTAKIPGDWKLEEDLNYEDEFRGYIIKGKKDRIRIEKSETDCFTETSVDEFADYMKKENSNIDSKNIPAGKGRTPDKLTPVETLKYPNGAYGVVYKNEFTTEVDGKNKFVEESGAYTFSFKGKDGVCFKIENTHYNDEGETLPTDLKIIAALK